MKIIILFSDDDKFNLELIKSEVYRDGSIHYIVKNNPRLVERIIPSYIDDLGEDLKIIVGKSFLDDKTYYKLAVRDKVLTFNPEVFFVNEDND